MKSLRYEGLVLAVIFLALACIASAQWSQGGDMVYLGDLSLVASSLSADGSAKIPAASGMDANAANNTTQNRTASDNNTINVTSEDLVPVSLGTAKPSAAEPSSKPILDLSAYAKDRAKNNLTGYTNIMYPIAGSRGSTTSTSSGGGCCGGG